MSEGNR
jgi:hypothetical protein